MVEPMVKRFFYHFEQDRPTNRLDRPEWYLDAVINFVQYHIPFIEQLADTTIANCNISDFNFETEFVQRIVDLARNKLSHELLRILDDDELFYHTITEVIAFQTVLFESYPDIEVIGCFEILGEKKTLDS